MNTRRMGWLALAATTLLLAACQRDEPAGVAASGESGSSLFATVPAGTPYLFGTIEHMPDSLVDNYFSKFAPMIEMSGDSMRQSVAKYKQVSDSDAEHLNLLVAWAEEFQDLRTRQDFETIGLAMPYHSVLYGVGPFPVLRLEISDSAAIQAMVDRVLARAGHTPTMGDYQGQAYYDVDTGDGPRFLIAIRDTELVAGMVHEDFVNEVLPNVMGEAPAETMDVAAELGAVNTEYGLSNYGSGYIDFQRLTELMLGDNPYANSLREAQGDSGLDPACEAEARGLARSFPRLVVGVTTLDENHVGTRGTLAMAPELANALAALPHERGGFDSVNQGQVSFAFGLSVPRLRDWLTGVAAERVANPYACDGLQGMNRAWTSINTNLQQPMLPMAGNILGVRMRIDEIDLVSEGGSMPMNAMQDSRFVMALDTSNPEMLLGMAQMATGLTELSIQPGDAPVQIPPQPGMPPADLWLARGDTSLGISMGTDMQQELPDYMASSSPANGRFLSLAYDMQLYADQVNKLVEQVAAETGEGSAELEDMKVNMGVYADIFDRVEMEFRFDGRGVTMDQNVSLKP